MVFSNYAYRGAYRPFQVQLLKVGQMEALVTVKLGETELRGRMTGIACREARWPQVLDLVGDGVVPRAVLRRS